MKMKNYLGLLLLICWGPLMAQPATYSLEDLRAAARENYPEFKRKGISEKQYSLEIDKLWKLLYPKMTFNAQASWQSAVTSIPASIPGIEVQKRDQYKAFVDVNQVLWDGGIVKRQLDLREAQQAAEQQSIEVSLNQVQEQIDLLFFSSLLLQDHEEQLGLAETTIDNKLKQVRGAVSNGVMLESNVWLLEAELVKNSQAQTELQAQRQTASRILAEWTGLPVDVNSKFEERKEEVLPLSPVIKRPEIQLFSLQKRSIEAGIAAVDAKYMPRVYGFAQLGYGRPGLNFLDTRFRPYALVGARLTWDIFDWGAGKIDKETIGLQKELLKVQEEGFERKTEIGLIQVEEDLNKLKALLVQDDALIALRGKIKETASAQLDNGVITATEYLDRVNEETAAKLSKSLHEIQILMTQAKYGYITGNN